MSHEFHIADHAADFRRLGAPVGCELAVLKRCYRLAVAALHPDRRANLGTGANDETELKEVNSAYRRLLTYHREHGHLPGRPRSAPLAPPPQATASGTGRVPKTGSAAARIMYASLAAIASVWVYSALERSIQTPEPAPRRMPAQTPTAQWSSAAAPVPDGTLRIGASKAEVRKVVGAPLLASEEIWEYGPSHIRFERGRVVDWYSSPLKPLPVAQDGGDGTRALLGD
jgi:hypothetical protein